MGGGTKYNPVLFVLNLYYTVPSTMVLGPSGAVPLQCYEIKPFSCVQNFFFSFLLFQTNNKNNVFIFGSSRKNFLSF